MSSISLPPKLTIIDDKLFKDCSSLSSVSIPDQVKVIGKLSFENCSNLSSIQLPNSITTIKTNAFLNCTSLSSLNLPDSLETVEFNSFVNVSSSISSLFEEKQQEKPSIMKISDDYINNAIKNILCISLETGLDNKISQKYQKKEFLHDYYYNFDKRDTINRVIYFSQFEDSSQKDVNSKTSLNKYQYHNRDIMNARYKGAPLFLDPNKITEDENGSKIIKLGIRTVYHATTRESVESILHDQSLKPGSNGMFGPGIYFAATPCIAKMKCTHIHHSIDAYILCEVDFGNALILEEPNTGLTLESIKNLGCNSIFGKSGTGKNWELVVYESERVKPIKIICLKKIK